MTNEDKKAIGMCKIFVGSNAMISYVSCDDEGNLIFPQCDTTPIEILLNLIEKQQKEIEDKDKQIDKLSLIRQETKYGYENVYIMTEDRLVTIELNKFIVEIANGEFVDIRKLYDDYKDSVPKEAIRELLESEYNGMPMYRLDREYLPKNLKILIGE